jgi:putative ABC transport system permease protein
LCSRAVWSTGITKIALNNALSDEAVQNLKDALSNDFRNSGWTVVDRTEPSPRLASIIERFGSFLALVGMTALFVGGVGVANAVRVFTARKASVMAIYQAMGASHFVIANVQFFQIMAIAFLGIALGLILGVLIPILLAPTLTAILPFPFQSGFYGDVLAIAALYGLLTAMTFTLWPLSRTVFQSAQGLFQGSTPFLQRFYKPYLFAAIASSLALIAAILFLSASRQIALLFVGAALCSFVVLKLMAILTIVLARRWPRPQASVARLALSNVYRPGNLTTSVILALGLGLSLLVSLSLIDGNLRQQLATTAPANAPEFFFLDIQNTQIDDFTSTLKELSPEASIRQAPMLRGRITALNDIPADQIEAEPEAAWVLRGDRGITHSATLPAKSLLTEGEWWPDNYQGEPLVSFIDEEGRALGLQIGDTVTINVLGREITARIANFREVEWQSLSINFVMVFSPNTFAGAPYSYLATLAMEDDSFAQQRAMTNALAKRFPSVTVINIRETLQSVNTIVEQLSVAMRMAALITLIASVLVLAGAMAASQRQKLYDSVVMKMVGATRWHILKATLLEYCFLGGTTVLFGVIAGSAIAYAIVTLIMDAAFVFLPAPALLSACVAFLITLCLGLANTWVLLGRKPAGVLRTL